MSFVIGFPSSQAHSGNPITKVYAGEHRVGSTLVCSELTYFGAVCGRRIPVRS